MTKKCKSYTFLKISRISGIKKKNKKGRYGLKITFYKIECQMTTDKRSKIFTSLTVDLSADVLKGFRSTT